MFRRSRIPELEARIAQLEAALSETAKSLTETRQSVLPAHGQALAGLEAWIKSLENGLADVNSAHSAQLTDLGRWLSSTTQVVTAMSSVPVIASPELQAIGPQARVVDDRIALTRTQQIWTVMRWLAQAPVQSDRLISVIMPTRNRREYLARAVASILAQTYANFELVIVDDASSDDTPEFLNKIEDPRIRRLAGAGQGAAAARNVGLQAATGEIVTHFDDDNLMDPNWLRSVAWAFSRWPATEFLYGARIVEDPPAQNGVPSGAMPVVEWQPFDRARLEIGGYIDMNVIAHRAGLPEAYFDTQLPSSMDWDMILRLTARHVPLELPVIACLYSNYAPNRISDRPNRLQENQFVRARVHTTRPMRVLSYNSMFPLLSETYIEEEMVALEAAGAEIAFASFKQSASPYPIRQKLYASLDEGVATQDPDLIVIYWLSHALGELHHLARIGRPFALRLHSVDFNVEDVMRVAAHPCCVGIWAYPLQAAVIPGAHIRAPIFMTHEAMPESASQRNLIASVSAGLPKKDWPLLLDAMNQLAECDRVILLARTNTFEDLPDEVARRAAELPSPVEVKINLPRHEVFELLSRTSVMLYTVVPNVTLGMPMSIIEALRAGACVITPDTPEMRALCGAGFRPYHEASDIVRHVREIMAGGDHIEQERKTNREWALRQFCDPAEGRVFHDQLSAALVTWRMQRQGASTPDDAGNGIAV